LLHERSPHGWGVTRVRRSKVRVIDTDPIRASRRQGAMNPELISLIVAIVLWIFLLGTMSTDG
jgi:hypothetical protein